MGSWTLQSLQCQLCSRATQWHMCTDTPAVLPRSVTQLQDILCSSYPTPAMKSVALTMVSADP